MVNMIKEGCENNSAIGLILPSKIVQKSNLSLKWKQWLGGRGIREKHSFHNEIISPSSILLPQWKVRIFCDFFLIKDQKN